MIDTLTLLEFGRAVADYSIEQRRYSSEDAWALYQWIVDILAPSERYRRELSSPQVIKLYEAR
jgi:hypothetical protein